MKKIITIPVAIAMIFGLFGCADMRGRDYGLASGAMLGGATGAALGGGGPGSVVGGVAGAAAGGTAGYFIGRSAERPRSRYYYSD
jgi:uncharacterized protein YcfJ